MSFAFKKFNFWQHSEVTEHGFPKNATCSSTSPHHLFAGCDNGACVVLDPVFRLVTSFQAHTFRVFHVQFLPVSCGHVDCMIGAGSAIHAVLLDMTLIMLPFRL
jgi:hypothetical protein